MARKIFQYVKPTRITLGEYRPSNGLRNHISVRFPSSPLLTINKGLIRERGKLRYPKNKRVKMLKTIIDGIRNNDPAVEIALCKEAPQIWRAVGLEMKRMTCNCVN